VQDPTNIQDQLRRTGQRGLFLQKYNLRAERCDGARIEITVKPEGCTLLINHQRPEKTGSADWPKQTLHLLGTDHDHRIDGSEHEFGVQISELMNDRTKSS